MATATPKIPGGGFCVVDNLGLVRVATFIIHTGYTKLPNLERLAASTITLQLAVTVFCRLYNWGGGGGWANIYTHMYIYIYATPHAPSFLRCWTRV